MHLDHFDRLPPHGLAFAVKSESLIQRKLFGSKDLLPFWVADMDFEVFPRVQEALMQAIERNNYSYQARPRKLDQLITKWYSERHGYLKTHFPACFSGGILNTISILIDKYSNLGEGVIIQTPVYHMFQTVIRDMGRQVVANDLKADYTGHYEMDLEALEVLAQDPSNKILLICHPHNPVGRIWTPETLDQVLAIAERNNLFVICDEVHGDIIHRHSFFSLLSRPLSVDVPALVVTSSGKTFGLPGLAEAYVFSNHQITRDNVMNLAYRLRTGGHPSLTWEATHAAFEYGDEWLPLLLDYLRGNIELVRSTLKSKMPEAILSEPEATFQLWINLESYFKTAEELKAAMTSSGLACALGHWFGQSSDRFLRMNIATPRIQLEKGLSCLDKMV